jgi:hypothetical protein
MRASSTTNRTPIEGDMTAICIGCPAGPRGTASRRRHGDDDSGRLPAPLGRVKSEPDAENRAGFEYRHSTNSIGDNSPPTVTRSTGLPATA